MKCEKCGSEIVLGQRFCGNCGMEQSMEQVQGQENSKDQFEAQDQKQVYSQPQDQGQQGMEFNQSEDRIQGQSPDQRQKKAPESGSNKSDTILTIFSIVCAIFYGVNALDRFLNFTGILFQGYLFGFRIIFSMVFVILDVVLGIWMCLILVCIAKKRTPENSDGLLLCLGGGGVALSVERLFQVFVNTVLYYGGFAAYFGRFSTTVIGVLMAVGGVYAILHFGMGENPIAEKSRGELLAEMKTTVFNLEKIIADKKDSFDEGTKGAQNLDNQTSFYTPAPFRLKTDRSLIVYIFLNIVTCGIYGLYFIYALARDINVACGGDGRKTAGLIKLILMSFVTCGIYNWIWYYSLGNRLASNASRYGMNFQENGTTILLWKLFGMLLCGLGPFIAMNIIIKNTNMLCGAYNHQHNM